MIDPIMKISLLFNDHVKYRIRSNKKQLTLYEGRTVQRPSKVIMLFLIHWKMETRGLFQKFWRDKSITYDIDCDTSSFRWLISFCLLDALEIFFEILNVPTKLLNQTNSCRHSKLYINMLNISFELFLQVFEDLNNSIRL